MQSFDSIVLIDDDPINNLINKRLISKLEFNSEVEEYLEAENALNAILETSSQKKLLILLDINMPVMNGWDFLKLYLEKCQNRKDVIVMLSSSIDFQDRKKSEEYPCVSGFIEKPLTHKKLLEVLKTFDLKEKE
ncbi:response regulator [Echinicola jeungdonensis]|uniref:Response regulator n=1 Tax=Echinicola jeungdonensis TaxID=709343 RepID=A0ABV5J4B5_9BACT|nr:response regulator [Echinicola jeungdonensis]MDN3670120.1 response regulator [Echinicola jeungdonensis]